MNEWNRMTGPVSGPAETGTVFQPLIYRQDSEVESIIKLFPYERIQLPVQTQLPDCTSTLFH